MNRSLLWSPTIAMSWLWGLGFFYAFDVTLTYGIAGFAAFAVPNVLGLYLFGRVLGRHPDPGALFERLSGRYAGWMIAYQVAAVGITLFGFGAHLVAPLAGPSAVVPAMVAIALAGCAIGQAVSVRGLARLHAALLPVGAALALTALYALSASVPSVEPKGLEAIDARLMGLALPSLAGFLLGPWLDVQQWQRAIEVRRSGGSPETAYAGGAILFLGLLCLNAAIALASGTPSGRAVLAGPTDLEGAPALAALASPLAVLALCAWATIAMATTLDSFQSAAGWFLEGVVRRSNSPLFALVPKGVTCSPLPILAAALWLAAWAWYEDLSHVHLMAPFATILLGAGACLAMEALGKGKGPDNTPFLFLGMLSLLAFLAGYAGPAPALLWASTCVGLAPALLLVFRARDPGAAASPVPGDTPAAVPVVPSPVAANAPPRDAGHWFEGKWFVIRVVPTYDDTNSVGNIYFANYIRWVGKAREMFFSQCMPDFDVKDTRYFVLTKSMRHDFRRETIEFDPVTVRVRVARYNRKFVTLQHEITSDRVGLLGRGEQELMFVDAATEGLVDIPGDIMRGFMPFMEGLGKRLAA